MLGWHISIYRHAEGGALPPTEDVRRGSKLAVWQADVDGLTWIRDLERAGNAVSLQEGGYPTRFAAQAKHVVAMLLNGPPAANAVWVRGPEDVTTAGWVGKTQVEGPEIDKCSPDEWLLIEAWDES